MGFQYILSSHTEKKRDMGERADESGQLSLDFLVGFSIFMLTLIVASSMLSGVLVGLQSKKIDYDAVAYRTGVILVEDPGEPNAFPNIVTIEETDQWEFIGHVQNDQVLRFGMSQYKSSPKILAHEKIESFFDRTIYPDLSDYRERIIFGDYPYNFNITLKRLDGGIIKTVGDPYPLDASYGYIRRVVQVKDPSSSTIDMTNYYLLTDGNGEFDVNINFSELVNATKGPKYWVDPLKERLSFTLTDIPEIRDLSTGAPNVVLDSVRLYFLSVDLAGVESYTPLPGSLDLKIDGADKQSSDLPFVVTENISMEFPPGYFIQPSKFTSGNKSAMKLRFQFIPSTANVSDIVSYQTVSGYKAPELKPAVLEVRVW
jgi:hypothetical protein